MCACVCVLCDVENSTRERPKAVVGCSYRDRHRNRDREGRYVYLAVGLFLKFSRCVLSNTTRQILIRTY
jgi:hypothetical protein